MIKSTWRSTPNESAFVDCGHWLPQPWLDAIGGAAGISFREGSANNPVGFWLPAADSGDEETLRYPGMPGFYSVLKGRAVMILIPTSQVWSEGATLADWKPRAIEKLRKLATHGQQRTLTDQWLHVTLSEGDVIWIPFGYYVLIVSPVGTGHFALAVPFLHVNLFTSLRSVCGQTGAVVDKLRSVVWDMCSKVVVDTIEWCENEKWALMVDVHRAGQVILKDMARACQSAGKTGNVGSAGSASSAAGLLALHDATGTDEDVEGDNAQPGVPLGGDPPRAALLDADTQASPPTVE